MTDAAGGRLIVFEGGEGSGKSTQLRRLSSALGRKSIPHICLREPGGTPLGTEVRRVLLDRTSDIDPRAEALLFMASRAQLVQREIRPALLRGDVVLLDRFFLSTYAYQIAGHGLPEDEVRSANRFATDGLVPDLTILLTFPVVEGLARAAHRAAAHDRMEAMGESFHHRVAAALATFAEPAWQETHPECGPIVAVDAEGWKTKWPRECLLCCGPRGLDLSLESRMKNRSIVAAAVLTSALVSGGWLMERGSKAGGKDLASRAHLFDEVLQHLRRDYVDTLPDSTLYRHAIDGALRELRDPHTVFLSPKRLTRLEEVTSGQYAGVGIQMDVGDSGITVIGTLPVSPAEQAGILTGDRIVSIEGKTTLGVTAEEALKALRGDAGTKVQLIIERPGIVAHMPFTLERRKIDINPVRHALVLRDSIGYVDLATFSTAAAADLAHAIDSLRSAGARSLVLDLRGDPGGLLDQGVSVADLFLNAGQAIVSTRGRGPDETRGFADHAAQRWADMPLVILTDSSSASASEIVAGALQDHDRAIIIGTATYGKGSAQRVFKLEDGAVKVTTALWYTPSGRSINRPRRPVTDDEDDDPPKSDSLPERPKFKTDAGRVILGGGGIVPDIEIAKRVVTTEDKALQAALGANVPKFRDAIVQYSLSLRKSGAVTDTNFTVTPAMRADLYRQLQARGVNVPRAVYDSASSLVTRALTGQLARYVFGQRVEFSRNLRDDPTMTRAVELLTGAKTQKELLARVPRQLEK